MRRLAPAALTAALLASCGGDAEPRAASAPAGGAFWPEPVGYEIDATWDERRASLRGTSRIRLRNAGPEPLDEVWLRAWPNALGSCAQPRARISVRRGGRFASRRHGCTAYEVRLDEPLEPGAETALEVRFDVRPPSRADRFGRIGRTAYLGSALPTPAVRDADGWRLPPYTDQGEAWFTLAAPWRVSVVHPRGTRVAATGTERERARLGDGRVRTVSAAPAARDVAMVIGPLRETRATVGGVRLRHHALPDAPRRAAARTLYAAGRSLTRFAEWYGPYGREELDLVQGPARVADHGVAMEYAELVLTPPAAAAVAHEVAHQWWAMLMGNDPWREPWLDESFAEYSQARLPDREGGRSRLGPCRPPERPPRPGLRSSMRVLERADYVAVAYVGGACTLVRLERALGTGPWRDALRGLVAEHRDGTWTTGDFIAAVRAAAPEGVDVDALLRREGLIG